MAIFNSFLYVYQAGYHCYKTPVVDEPRVNYPTHQAPAAVRLPGPGRPRGRCSAMGIPHDGQDTSMLYRLYVGCVIPHTHIITYNHIYIIYIHLYTRCHFLHVNDYRILQIQNDTGGNTHAQYHFWRIKACFCLVLKASAASRIDGCHSRSPMRADESTKGQRMWSAAPRNFGKNPHSMQSKLGDLPMTDPWCWYIY